VKRLRNNSSKSIKASLEFPLFQNFPNYVEFPASSTLKLSESCLPQISKNEKRFLALKDEWKELFTGTLVVDILKHRYNELEYLLFLKLVGELPPAISGLQAEDSLKKIVSILCGFEDAKSAFPPKPLGALNRPQKDLLEPPSPIQLKKVSLPEVKLENDVSGIASFVPKDFFYVEWPTWGDFQKSCEFIDKQAQDWAPGFYPWSVSTRIERYLDDLGLSKVYIKENIASDTGPVVLAGREPFFAAGTGLIMIIKDNKKSIPIPESNRLSKKLWQSSGSFLLVANERELFDDVLTLATGESLREDSGFRYSRNRLSGSPENTSERLFLYLSDPWFNRLVSPRSLIQNLRLAGTDAKIRMVELLKLMWMCEYDRISPPKITELKAKSIINKAWNDWLLEDLVDSSKGVISKSMGGLYSHHSISSLPFNKVSKEEFEFYENFKKNYARLWEKMDPVALQILQNSNERSWISRLFVSPISNKSFFNDIRSTLWCFPTKSCHNLNPVRGQIFGLSLAIVYTDQPAFIKLSAFDFTLPIFSPKYWLTEFSYKSLDQLPIAISTNNIAYESLVSMVLIKDILEINPIPGIERIISPIFKSLVYKTEKAEKYYKTYSLNLETLQRLISGHSEIRSTKEAPDYIKKAASDSVKTESSKLLTEFRGFLDLIAGAKFRRFLLHSLAKKKAIESWHRRSRLRRITQRLGFEKEEELPGLKKNGIFSFKSAVNSEIFDEMSLGPKERSENNLSLNISPGYIKLIESLPKPILLLNRIDFSISEDGEGLFFETHADFSDSPKYLHSK
jgi:hypothetical protein